MFPDCSELHKATYQAKENLAMALEHYPECLVRRRCPYILCELNGFLVQALIDTGANTSAISMSCLKRVGLESTLDKDFKGTAYGIGTAEKNGRVHLSFLKIGESYFATSLHCIELKDDDIIIGMNLLSGCQIDFVRNQLCIGKEIIPFLSEEMFE